MVTGEAQQEAESFHRVRKREQAGSCLGDRQGATETCARGIVDCVRQSGHQALWMGRGPAVSAGVF